mmetsp:Transcript_13334/g.23721  ORF Transcript_13334/g.23721 Transcript_13334/m.23721 type:complete len:281 (-) Transcript_13334:196-1038(-)
MVRPRSVALNHCDLIANAVLGFEKKRRSAALQFSICHDSNAVTKNISFVHVMCGQDDASVLFVTRNSALHKLASSNIKTRSGFIQNAYLCIQQSNRKLKLALHTATQEHRLDVALLGQSNIFENLNDLAIDLPRWDPLDRSKQAKVFVYGHDATQNVLLCTNAQSTANITHVVRARESIHDCPSFACIGQSRKDRAQCCLSCTVASQKHRNLVFENGEGDAANSMYATFRGLIGLLHIVDHNTAAVGTCVLKLALNWLQRDLLRHLILVSLLLANCALIP